MNRDFVGAFSAGEISPELFGQIGLSKRLQAAEIVRNFEVRAEGPVENRPGTELVKALKFNDKRVRLVDFRYSNSQMFCLEVGEGYFRFHAQGATLLVSGTPASWSAATTYNVGQLVTSLAITYYCKAPNTNKSPASNAEFWHAMPADGTFEIPNNYAEGDLAELEYVQSADVMTFTHVRYPIMELKRRGENDWIFTPAQIGPAITPPSGVAAVATAGTGTTTYQYVVTAVQKDTLVESSSSSLEDATAFTVTAVSQSVSALVETAAAHGLAVGNYAQFSGLVGGMSPLNGNVYYIATVPSATTFTIATQITIDIPFGGSQVIVVPVDTSSFGPYTGGGTGVRTSGNGDPLPGLGVASVNNDLTTSPNKNTISWNAVEGAVRYNVYKLDNGLFGRIGQTAGLSFVDQNITADVSRTPPIQDAILSSPNNYPGAVAYFEQRRVFAGSLNQPQNVWATKSGTESNFTYAIPFTDSDRLAFRIAAREASRIRHLVPVTDLIGLTESTEYRISSNNGALTPIDINVKPQSYIGSNTVKPVVVGSTVIFAQERGGRIRELAYEERANGFITSDISILASHLFDYEEIVSMAFARAPRPILWCVTASGRLLGLTYVPEQQIGAWHRHDTGDGDMFEDVVTISEIPGGSTTAEDMVYLATRRVINGEVVRFLERKHTRRFTRVSDCWFLDCAAASYAPGRYEQNGTVLTCFVTAHGLTTATSARLEFDDESLDETYVVTVLDDNRFTIPVPESAKVRIGSMAVLPSSPLSTVSVPWLEGRTVNAIVDGAPVLGLTVTAGSVTLGEPGYKIVVGLPVEADVKLAPLVSGVDEAAGQGRVKNVNRVGMRVYRSSGLFAGPDFDRLSEYVQRSDEPWGTTPRLITDEVEIVLEGAWSSGGAVAVRQSEPLPLTVVSVMREAEVGGG